MRQSKHRLPLTCLTDNTFGCPVFLRIRAWSTTPSHALLAAGGGLGAWVLIDDRSGGTCGRGLDLRAVWHTRAGWRRPARAAGHLRPHASAPRPQPARPRYALAMATTF